MDRRVVYLLTRRLLSSRPFLSSNQCTEHSRHSLGALYRGRINKRQARGLSGAARCLSLPAGERAGSGRGSVLRGMPTLCLYASVVCPLTFEVFLKAAETSILALGTRLGITGWHTQTPQGVDTSGLLQPPREGTCSCRTAGATVKPAPAPACAGTKPATPCI